MNHGRTIIILTAHTKDWEASPLPLSDLGKFSLLSELSYETFDLLRHCHYRAGPTHVSLSSRHPELRSSRSGLEGSGALDEWRQGVLLQLEPAPVIEIVITEPGHHHQPHDGGPGLAWPSDNLPQTINNHHPPPHYHSLTEAARPEFLHITEKWHGVLYFAARNPKKQEKESTRPARNYMDCIPRWGFDPSWSILKIEMIVQ